MSGEGYQAGLHAPKIGCWGCLELFAEMVQHWVEEDGHCEHPESGGMASAFRAWADGSHVAHAEIPAT